MTRAGKVVHLLVLEPVGKGAEDLATVGDGVFLFGGEVGHSAVHFGEPENWIVAEAAVAGGGLSDSSRTNGGEMLGRKSGSGKGDVAVEPSSALRFGSVFEVVENDRHFFGEGGFFTGESFGIDAKFAREGVYFEPSVVSEAPFSGGLGGGFGFDGGVFGVC